MTIRDPTRSCDDQVPSIAALLEYLNSDDTNIAEDAQYSLQELGGSVVEPVLAELPRLGVFGQRCALDLLAHLPSDVLQRARRPSVEEAVAPLLKSDDFVVREWAADELAHAEARNTIPLLRQALERANVAGIDLAEGEPVALRRALTALGDRQQVMPVALEECILRSDSLGPHWPARRLARVIEALAEENQVLLYFQVWKYRKGSFYWVETPCYDVDFHGPWPIVVARARAAALQAAAALSVPKDAVVTLEWIDVSDR